ncbi:MAG: class II fructose-bisphosphatase [Chloroflexi bacterium]|nr:class II fructose-bisphosphatase [Chloroflexota bacterium]
MEENMSEHIPSRNIGLDLIRVTETTALAAGRWMGSGDKDAAHRTATQAMRAALNTLNMNGRIIIGEDREVGNHPLPYLETGQTIGTGIGPEVDVIVDPIDGTKLLIKGQPGAISLVGVAPRGTLWSPAPAAYMEKIVVDRQAANVLVPECLDAPAAWTLALIARVKQKAINDLRVIILNRQRNHDLIEEVRATGASILLRDEGDAEGALLAATPKTGVDLLMGIGGASQGAIAACAVKALHGGMLTRLAPQSQTERDAIRAAGFDEKRIHTCDEMVHSNELFFAATGITNSQLLPALKFHGLHADTHSLLIRSETGTRRFIHAEHWARVRM